VQSGQEGAPLVWITREALVNLLFDLGGDLMRHAGANLSPGKMARNGNL